MKYTLKLTAGQLDTLLLAIDEADANAQGDAREHVRGAMARSNRYFALEKSIEAQARKQGMK